MGLTKQYNRYAPCAVFGIIGSSGCNIIKLSLKGSKERYCAVGSCEHVLVWDLRRQEKFLLLLGEDHEVTRLCSSPDNIHLAAGYADGAIRIFDILENKCTVNFSGHKSAITSLNYDGHGMRLVSGSKDTVVIVWDIINESGLFRLNGHKSPITQARFLKDEKILISSSKDTLVKFWDLTTQHCFYTLVGHRAEVWDFCLLREDSILVTGSVDSELRFWSLHNKLDVKTLEEKQEESNNDIVTTLKRKRNSSISEFVSSDAEEDNEAQDILKIIKMGSIIRKKADKVLSIEADSAGEFFFCHGADKFVEIFKIKSESEIKSTLKKKAKRLKKKMLSDNADNDFNKLSPSLEVSDKIKYISCLQFSSKIKSSFFCKISQSIFQIVTLLVNNSLQMLNVDLETSECKPFEQKSLTLFGHRSDPRTVCFSSDNSSILSASKESVKIWNRDTLQCISTLESDFALCSLFAPGDRNVLIGTKTGNIQIFELGSGCLVDSIVAHEGSVWSLALTPDKRRVTSGGADHDVKFWEIELISDENVSRSSKHMSLKHVKTLKMSEDVLCLKYSFDNRLLAVGLLDNTVKIFFTDTLKFFLSLYGHKLPVLCLDICTDNSLIITGSADRNVKIWGLDFGDCHKSIFAHDDSIMCVQFIPKTHMFFTAGKDAKIKQWDADTFDHILTLTGHHSEIWCLAISSRGNFLITGSHDKTLRLWEKTDEPLVLEDERETEREKEYETSTTLDQPIIAGETNKESGLAGKRSLETIKSAEKIMEALELYGEEMQKISIYEAECKESGSKPLNPPRHPLLQVYNCDSPLKYVLEILKRVKSSEIEESLLVLPFGFVIKLLNCLNQFLKKGWNSELTCRCLFFILRVHQGQITSNQVLSSVINELKINTGNQVKKIKDTIGFNLSALTYIKKHIEENEDVHFFTDATEKFQEKKIKRKKFAMMKINS